MIEEAFYMFLIWALAFGWTYRKGYSHRDEPRKVSKTTR